MNIAYLNGQECDDLHVVSLYNPSFLYGINCFEGIRAYWHEGGGKLVPLDMGPHLDRLYLSAHRMGLAIPVSRSTLEREIVGMLARHDLQEDVYIRITIFLGGDGSWRSSHDVHYVVSVRSKPTELGRTRSVALGVSRFRRISSDAMPPQVKAGANYLNSRYAYLDAVARGFDDALFLTTAGFVSESTGSAIFFVEGDSLVTPSLDCDILASITRSRVIGNAALSGRVVREDLIGLDQLRHFDAAFLVGTSIEVCTVSAIEDHRYSADHPVLAATVRDFADRIAEGRE